MTLESDLKHALRRQSPDAGFAGRVMARLDETDAPAVPRKRPVWWRAAAASVLLASVLGGYTTWRVAEHRKGERAKEQLLLAMRIASEKASYARHEVHDIGSR